MVLVSCQSVGKSYTHRLFQGITIHIDERERLGLIGPNGTGKSTLLKIMAGIVEPDEGTAGPAKGVEVGYVDQEDLFEPGLTVEKVVFQGLEGAPLEEYEKQVQVDIALTKAGFDDNKTPVDTLSGGWKKRLSLARQLVREPHVLLLDEPTNHLDIEGILWLENLLIQSNTAFVLVSHDRYFLENVATRIVEINQAYPDNFLNVDGNYSQFLEKREEFFRALSNQERRVATKVKREVEWLRQGVKARATRANFRMKKAQELQSELSDIRQRQQVPDKKVDIDFSSTGRKTHRLLVAEDLEKSRGGKKLFTDLSFILTRGMKMGILGPNGCGKSTLLKILMEEMEPDRGEIHKVEKLQVVYFSQTREQLDKNMTLRDALAPSKDQVQYQGRTIPVEGWAQRFLFTLPQLRSPVGQLSGGEQARLLIARLMLEPSDVLLLDEPTNDLDLPSLQVLEESLLEFPGALVLVTHDRYLLDQVCNVILGMGLEGGPRLQADFSQWLRARKEKGGKEEEAKKPAPEKKKEKPKAKKKRLSYKEKQEYSQMEEKILEAEEELEEWKAKVEDPEIMADYVLLQEYCEKLDAVQMRINQLYSRWEELESRMK